MSTHCKLRMCEHSGYRMFTHCKHTMFAQHHLNICLNWSLLEHKKCWKLSPSHRCEKIHTFDVYSVFKVETSLTLFYQISSRWESYISFTYNKQTPLQHHQSRIIILSRKSVKVTGLSTPSDRYLALLFPVNYSSWAEL